MLVVRARTPDLVLEVTEPRPTTGEFSPDGGAPPREVELTFFVREADDARAGRRSSTATRTWCARSTATSRSAEREPVTYVWDGRTDDGATARRRAATGCVVELPSEDREMIWPRRITVAAEPPVTD